MVFMRLSTFWPGLINGGSALTFSYSLGFLGGFGEIGFRSCSDRSLDGALSSADDEDGEKGLLVGCDTSYGFRLSLLLLLLPLPLIPLLP
jgi:hypothetical protein